jgi:hypothetical protein
VSLPFDNRGAPDRYPIHAKDFFLNIRREVEHVHDLGDPGARDVA